MTSSRTHLPTCRCPSTSVRDSAEHSIQRGSRAPPILTARPTRSAGLAWTALSIRAIGRDSELAVPAAPFPVARRKSWWRGRAPQWLTTRPLSALSAAAASSEQITT